MRDDILPIKSDQPAASSRFLLDASSGQLVKLPNRVLDALNPPPLLKGLVTSAIQESFTRSTPTGEDESVDTFIRRRFHQPVPLLISAMCHGIYAAAPQDLSVRSVFPGLWDAEARYGSVVWGMLRARKSAEDAEVEAKAAAELGPLWEERKSWGIYGLRGGLASLTHRLEATVRSKGIEILLSTPVDKVERVQDAVRISTSSHTFSSDHVISSISPSRLAQTLPSPYPQLTANPSTSAGVVNLVFDLPYTSVHPPGFGYLIPGSNSVDGILGVVFDSTALPGLDEPLLDGKLTKLTVMMGGPHWLTYGTCSMPSDPQDLVGPALRHVRRSFPALQDREPVLVVPHLQKDCIPTYAPGHGARMRELHRAMEQDWDGKLSLVGNGCGGVGVNDCIYSVEQVLERLLRDGGSTGLERWADWH